jgi:eukaryotic-like serine/threonine-protein kinase
MTNRWEQINSLFLRVLDMEPAERPAFVAEACAGDEELRQEIETLLASHEQASQFLEKPLVDAGRLAGRTAEDAGSGPQLDPWLTAEASVRSPLQARAAAGVMAENETHSRLEGIRPGSRVAHYRVDERLGSGGMGEVFRAWDLALDRAAAVKVIRPGFDPSFTRRLLREVDAAARLQHPGIATFFEGGQDGGCTYFAMELVEGTTLRERLESGPLPTANALTITAGLLEALAHAHAAGVLHRDIKPENVIIGQSGAPKLLDFGLARRLFESDIDDSSDCDPVTVTALTAHGAIAGTPGYMSPEQLRGEPLGPASDLFQVGAVLYEMLTGRRAFGEGSVVARLGATLAGLPDLTPITLTGPAGLDAIARRALAARPADRFASAGDFLLALDALAEARVRTTLPDSLVITDFVNHDGDTSNDWIGSALAESLADDLGRIEGVQVAARSHMQREAAKLREAGDLPEPDRIALLLGSRWAVAGSYERSGGHLRLFYRLIDASTGAEASTGELQATVRSVFELGDRLAQAIADALHVQRRTTTRAESRETAHALELQAKARAIWRNAGRVDTRVIAMLEEAVGVSPDCAPVLGAFVGALAGRYIASGDSKDLERAIEMSERALGVDPSNTEVWMWRGYAFFRLDRLAEALEALARAVVLGSSDPAAFYMYGSTLQVVGREEEALAHLQRAVTIDPRFSIAWLSLGWSLSCMGRYEEARYAYSRAKALEGQPGPTMVAGVGGYIADCLRCEGRLTEARIEALQGVQSVERSDFSYRDTIRALCLGALGRATLLLDDRAAAHAAFAQAIAQMRGRSRTQAGGHVLVHALAGLSRTTGDPAAFEEGLRTFETRDGYSFKYFFGCSDAFTLLELARTAHALGRQELARSLLARARSAGCREPFGCCEP